MKSKNSFKSLSKLNVGNKEYNYYSLPEAEKNGLEGIGKLPKSLKVLLENDGSATVEQIATSLLTYDQSQICPSSDKLEHVSL